MAFNNNITPGSPPLIWSNVQEAFVQINENFDVLVATVGGGSLVDFSSLDTDVKPTTDNLKRLGDETHQWKAVHTADWQDIPGSENNGVWIGAAQIKGITGTIEIPAFSTVGGELIIDPTKTFFKTIQVDDFNSLEAADRGSTLNLNSGTAMQLVVDSAGESITFNNTGVTQLAGTAGQIGISNSTGSITLTNLGVLSLTSTTALPIGRVAGTGINISASTGSGIKVTNTGVVAIEAGSAALTVSTDAVTGIVTITNTAPAGNAFRYVIVDGDSGSPLESNSVNGALNILSGFGIALSKDAGTDSVILNIDPVFDLKGSIFGDDSSTLVDAVNGYIYGNVSATTLRTAETQIAIGSDAGLTTQGALAVAIGDRAGQTSQSVVAVAVGAQAGETSQGNSAVAVGYLAGQTTQGGSAVAIGRQAGNGNQGANAIAIGDLAGFSNQAANSIIINAAGTTLNAGAAGFYVDPIRSTANGTPLMYDSTTKEIFYSSVLTFTGSTIDTGDSSGITVAVQTTFNTDVVVENDLDVVQQLTVQGSRVINLTELKSVVAASTDFADFQTRIAAL